MKLLLTFTLSIFISFGLYAQDWTLIGEFESGVGDMLGDEESNRLYVVGAFDSINGKYIRGIAAWDGKQWNELDHGINYDTLPRSWGGACHHISRYKNKLVIGGDFHSVGFFQKSRNAALWNPDSSKWETLDWNTDKTVSFVYDTGDTTYVLGTYDSIAGKHSPGATYLYKGQWTNMSPPNGVEIPKVLTPYQNSLYLGGNMNGSIPGINDLARRDGAKFHAVGHGVSGAFGWVNDLIVYKNELYVGGSFFKADGHTGENIMKWDGTQFHSVGDANNVVHALAENNGILYVGGYHDSLNGIQANKIAWFNGKIWSGLGNETHTNILKMAFLNDTLYVYRQQSINTITHNQVLRYNKKLPTGLTNTTSYNKEIMLFPNPTTGFVEIQGLKNNDTVKIYDLSGTLVYAGAAKKINVSHLPNGLYAVSIKSSDNMVHLKFLKQ